MTTACQSSEFNKGCTYELICLRKRLFQFYPIFVRHWSRHPTPPLHTKRVADCRRRYNEILRPGIESASMNQLVMGQHNISGT